MVRKPLAWPSSHLLQPPALDRSAAERVTQWVTRWHEVDYDQDEIAEMLEGWPVDVPLDGLLMPFKTVLESESAVALARMALKLISLVEAGRLQATQARGAFRMACRHLCERGIPFEETAKGDETALWFHFIGVNEFGDSDNTGYATDFSELRLLARQLIDPERLVEEFLAGEFPRTFHEGYVNVAGALGDGRLAPLLLRILQRCEDAPALATTITALGELANLEKADAEKAVEALVGYAYSANPEIATATVLALESLGGAKAERVLNELQELLPQEDNLLAAHVAFALMRIRHGELYLKTMLVRAAGDGEASTTTRICAVERLGGWCDREVVEAIARLLDDPTIERVRVDGYLTDDVVYVVREAAYMALMECRIRYLVEVLGEGVLNRLETFQMYSMPSWWLSSAGNDEEEA